MRRVAAVTAGAALIALALTSPAAAFYGNGAAIVSADFNRLEQGDASSNFGAISGDGRYAAIQTQASNFYAADDPDPPGKFRRGGIFRRTLDGPALDKVADGDLRPIDTPGTLLVRGAQNPSISADGRFVSFSTAQRLVPADVNDNVDVYVRDMTQPSSSPTAYTLVSAKDGGVVPATYAPPATHVEGGDLGAEVSPGAAISADGRKVVFRAAATSDLPDHASADVPAGQLFVRDLDTMTTTLVTRNKDDGTPAGGAVGPSTLSGDGTAVAWSAQNAPAQALFLDGESQSPGLVYFLWRRVADGPSAPTRRLTGPVDVDDPGCDLSSTVSPVTTAQGPCYGPLTAPEGARGGIATKTPSLSADGYRVAFLTSSGPRPNDDTGNALDLWVTVMRPGVSRKDGSRELTRDPFTPDITTSGSIDAAVISSDGRRIALVTSRTRLLLPTPRLVGTLRRNPDARDLLLIDLGDDTIERVTRSFTGGDANGDTATAGITMDRTGDRIVFSSSASNLFRGDANEAADVFLARRQAEPSVSSPPPEEPFVEPPIPDIGSLAPPGDLEVRAKSLPKGVVQLSVDVPETGQLDAVAKSVPKSASSGRKKKKKKTKTKAETISTATVKDAQEGTVAMKLQPLGRFKGVIKRAGKVSASVLVTFKPSSAASAALSRSVRANFVWKPAKKSSGTKRKPKRKKRQS
jgi:hypothetical protein